jgi:hypothetical protein
VIADLTCIAGCNVTDSPITNDQGTPGLIAAEARAKSVSDNVDAERAFIRAFKRFGLEPENAFVLPEDQEARDEHLSKLKKGILHLYSAIRNDFDTVQITGLPVQHPGKPGHLKAAVDALRDQTGRINRKTVYPCAGKDMDTGASFCRGTIFYHLVIRDPDLVRDWFKHASSLKVILEEYRTVDIVSDSILDLTKRMSDIAHQVCRLMRKVPLALEQQTLSFCSYLLSYAQSLDVKVIPETSLEIWLALKQARDVCHDIKAKDGYQWLEGYIEQGAARKRNEQDVVVDLVQHLEEELKSRYNMRVKLSV